MHTYKHACAHTYTNTCMHTHTHMHAHTHCSLVVEKNVGALEVSVEEVL